MNRSILKNSFAGITATIAAVSFGYLAVQYFGKYMMLAIGTGMFGLGAAVHRTQQSIHQASLPDKLEIIDSQPKTTQVRTPVKELNDTAKPPIPTTTNHHSITIASRLVKNEVNITKVASSSQSSGYCRKRLALCHKAKLESSRKVIAKN